MRNTYVQRARLTSIFAKKREKKTVYRKKSISKSLTAEHFPRQIAENIARQGAKLRVSPVRRIPATNNLVYEFNPFGDIDRPSTSRPRRPRDNNSGHKLPRARTGFGALIFFENTRANCA